MVKHMAEPFISHGVDYDPQNPKALSAIQEVRRLHDEPQGDGAARNVVAVLGDPGVQPRTHFDEQPVGADL